MSINREQLLADITACLSQEPSICFAVAFEAATRSVRRRSATVDVAIRFDSTMSPEDRFEKEFLLSGALQGINGPSIDITDIEELPLLTAYRTVNGEFLCGDALAYHRFRTQTNRKFEARKEELTQYHENVITRIAEDGLRG